MQTGTSGFGISRIFKKKKQGRGYMMEGNSLC